MSSIIAIVTSFIIILFRNHHQFQCAQNSLPLCFSGLWTFFTYFVSFALCGISHALLNYSSYKHLVWLWTLNMSWDLTFGVISKKHLLLEAYCLWFLALFRLYMLHISCADILDYPLNVLPQSIVCLETISLLALKMHYSSSCFLESPYMISLPKLLLYRWHAPQHLPVWADLSTYSSRSQAIVKSASFATKSQSIPKSWWWFGFDAICCTVHIYRSTHLLQAIPVKDLLVLQLAQLLGPTALVTEGWCCADLNAESPLRLQACLLNLICHVPGHMISSSEAALTMDQRSALHFAAEAGSAVATAVLLGGASKEFGPQGHKESTADVTFRDCPPSVVSFHNHLHTQGQTSLQSRQVAATEYHWTEKWHFVSLRSILFRCQDMQRLEAVTDRGETPLARAAARGHGAVVRAPSVHWAKASAAGGLRHTWQYALITWQPLQAMFSVVSCACDRFSCCCKLDQRWSMQTALVRCAGVPGMGRGRCADRLCMWWLCRAPGCPLPCVSETWSSGPAIPCEFPHNSWRLIPICASSRDCATLIFRLSVPLSFWSLHFFALSWAINQLQPFGSKNQRECRGSHSGEQGAIWPKQWCFGKKILVVRCCSFNAFCASSNPS